MRRALSVIFLVLGGWLLSSEGAIAWMAIDKGFGMKLGIMVMMAVLALPLLLIGSWISPGNRKADLGLTLMITAGVTAFIALTFFAIMSDRAAIDAAMPPGQKMPDLRIDPVAGVTNLLVIAALGYALWRWGRRTKQPSLERIFGD